MNAVSQLEHIIRGEAITIVRVVRVDVAAVVDDPLVVGVVAIA